MATGKGRTAPGTTTGNCTRSTMDAPFGKAASAREGVGGGTYGRNTAPFDAPQSMGNGSIPTKFMDGMPDRVAASKMPTSAGLSAAPSAPGPTRPGTKQYAYGR